MGWKNKAYGLGLFALYRILVKLAEEDTVTTLIVTILTTIIAIAYLSRKDKK